MTLPENLPVDFTAYNHLTFLPLGRKNKSIRSVGSKHTKGLLGRLNDYFERAMNELSQEDIVLFKRSYMEVIGAVFPSQLIKMKTFILTFGNQLHFYGKNIIRIAAFYSIMMSFILKILRF